MRTAEVLSMLVNTHRMLMAMLARKKTAPKLVYPTEFLPNYLRAVSTETVPTKSLEQQHAEFRAFTARYRAAVEETKKGRRRAAGSS